MKMASEHSITSGGQQQQYLNHASAGLPTRALNDSAREDELDYTGGAISGAIVEGYIKQDGSVRVSLLEG